jgi:glycyl-tRNA synthetase
MDTLYDRNGLIFWTEREIKLREMMVNYFVAEMRSVLKNENRAFEMFQVEAPILTPHEFVNKTYSPEDYFQTEDTAALDPNYFKIVKHLVLRPETTMGSYRYAEWLLNHTETKTKLPICIWQHGKSFRREQDQVTKNMRLKEFYQLEFQCIYGLTTANDYSKAVIPVVHRMISDMIGQCRIEKSDRLPDYAEETTDIVCNASNMEVCSISKRKDFKDAKVLEVAIGTDRCVYNWSDYVV